MCTLRVVEALRMVAAAVVVFLLIGMVVDAGWFGLVFVGALGVLYGPQRYKEYADSRGW